MVTTSIVLSPLCRQSQMVTGFVPSVLHQRVLGLVSPLDPVVRIKPLRYAVCLRAHSWILLRLRYQVISWPNINLRSHWTGSM